MFPQMNRGNSPKFVVTLLLPSVIYITFTPVASAHKIETAGDVGATLHIEPNDNPRAGEPSTAWFALTRKGGKIIPLAECDCQLAVYAEPHVPGEPALLLPPLKPVAAERYKGIPGAEIIFPRPGAYQLQLSGKPAEGESFQPFNLNFDITVAAGKTVVEKTQNIQNVDNNVTSQQSGIPFWAIALSGVVALGVFFAILQKRKRG
jgi:hypothetical protein